MLVALVFGLDVVHSHLAFGIHIVCVLLAKLFILVDVFQHLFVVVLAVERAGTYFVIKSQDPYPSLFRLCPLVILDVGVKLLLDGVN